MQRKTTLWLTVQYSLFFLAILALFSAGLYKWTDNTFDQNYIKEVEQRLGTNDDTAVTAWQHKTVEAAAEIAVGQFRSVLLSIDIIALIAVPLVSYFIASKSLKPLLETNERQKRFVTNASHELRTPLAVMSGEFDLALKKKRDVDFYRETIISGKEELDRLTHLTNQLLELQRIEGRSNKASLKMKKVPVVQIIKRSISQNAKLAKVHEHTLTFSPPTNSPEILASETLLQTALDNLISNAAKYSKEDTEIIIGCEEGANSIAIYVQNQPKKPLTEKERQMIFERFFQPKEELTKNGFGLGLSIVKAIIEVHDGKVQIQSNGDSIRFSLILRFT